MLDFAVCVQDRIMRYALGWNPDSGNVMQWRSVHAIYYTPMSFRVRPWWGGGGRGLPDEIALVAGTSLESF